MLLHRFGTKLAWQLGLTYVFLPMFNLCGRSVSAQALEKDGVLDNSADPEAFREDLLNIARTTLRCAPPPHAPPSPPRFSVQRSRRVSHS